MELSNKKSDFGGYFEEIDIAKGLAIVLVVLGHSFPDAETSWNIIGKESVAQFVFSWIYSFHMPLFFLLSGFLFIPRMERNDIKTSIIKRFKRLMIPYFFFSIIYIGLKTFGAVYANHPLSNNAVLDMFLGISPAGGCWFLWVLFMMCVISILARKIGAYGLLALAVIMLILFYIDKSWMIGNIDSVFHRYIWFAIGGVIANYYNKIRLFLNHLIIGIVSFLLLTISHYYFHGLWTDLFKPLCGIMMAFSIGCVISEKGGARWKKYTIILGKYCMDIYIISMLIVIPMRIVYINFDVFTCIPYYLWVVLATCLGFVLPIIVSKGFIRKNKILKMLVLGS